MKSDLKTSADAYMASIGTPGRVAELDAELERWGHDEQPHRPAEVLLTSVVVEWHHVRAELRRVEEERDRAYVAGRVSGFKFYNPGHEPTENHLRSWMLEAADWSPTPQPGEAT